MRSRWIVVLTIATGTLGLLVATAIAQETRISKRNEKDTHVFVQQSAERLSALIRTSIADGYRLGGDTGMTIAGGWLAQSHSKWVSLYSLTLVKGTKYRFLAAGDADAQDVDLRIVDKRNNVLAKDSTTAREAVVDFTPPVTSEYYYVQVRLYASRDNLPCICLTAALQRK